MRRRTNRNGRTGRGEEEYEERKEQEEAEKDNEKEGGEDHVGGIIAGGQVGRSARTDSANHGGDGWGRSVRGLSNLALLSPAKSTQTFAPDAK